MNQTSLEIINDRVEWFSRVMGVQLKNNLDKKTAWQRDTIKTLVDRLKEEVTELELVCANDAPVAIIKEAADVANFAMFIADNATRLDTSESEGR